MFAKNFLLRKAFKASLGNGKLICQCFSDLGGRWGCVVELIYKYAINGTSCQNWVDSTLLICWPSSLLRTSPTMNTNSLVFVKPFSSTTKRETSVILGSTAFQ